MDDLPRFWSAQFVTLTSKHSLWKWDQIKALLQSSNGNLCILRCFLGFDLIAWNYHLVCPFSISNALFGRALQACTMENVWIWTGCKDLLLSVKGYQEMSPSIAVHQPKQTHTVNITLFCKRVKNFVLHSPVFLTIWWSKILQCRERLRVALKTFENCCRRIFEGSQVSLQFPCIWHYWVQPRLEHNQTKPNQ